ncbi:hypothetical protein EPUS_04670 [Endocarpon pusillum Z07020]|uniref:Uncharacterized protein n=1 Tax=Endocarpon pusillum (strain Z07020 / HMAS-L-300199) TaxID=1263415 RepID=U1FUT2_ENDPU|nr:uncharacterized protein EPUS_04670 [Endocarpon pusillum Z07020]ERF68572.1 hypothetical protein EPUS_04670 [Endocarpon pusillum Z07020]
MTNEKHPVHLLTPLDNVAPSIHLQKHLYIPARDDPSALLTTLRDALARTITEVPMLAGCVGPNATGAQRGSLLVEGPYLRAGDILLVKDLRDMLMLAQVYLLHGGLFLFVAIAHTVVDERGLFNILRVWSTRCRGGQDVPLVEPHWTDRKALMQQQGKALSEDTIANLISPEGEPTSSSKTISGHSVMQSTLPPSSVGPAVFFFSNSSLARLKLAASATIAGQSSPWISTNDALCALFWCSITRARAGESSDNNIITTVSYFNMMIDCRSRLLPPLPADYIGNSVLATKTHATFGYLLSSDPSRLADVASMLRTSLLAVNDTYIKDLIGTIRSAPNISSVTRPAYPSFQRNVACTSWANQAYYELD